MKAVLCKTLDGPDALVVEEIAEPEPGPGEVVIDVAAAGLNFYDTLAIRGKYQVKPELPFSPGGEIAGTVAALGAGVEGIAPGQRVIAYMRFNGCREKAVAGAADVIPVPDGVSDAAAAGVTVTYGTAAHALKDRGRLEKGQTLAVLGASGGAGLAAVEIGTHLGARVIACASSADKLALACEHGADEGVNYTDEDLKTRLREIAGGEGPDVIYDCVGGPLAESAFRAIAWGGRFLVIGFAAGEITKMPLNLALLKGADIAGVFWSGFAQRHPDKHRANIEQVLGWCASGDLQPHIHATYPLENIADAFGAIDDRQVRGKVIVTP